jgi:hypothetical protein
MYIRRTHTHNSATGERYYTHRLVANQRIGGKLRQTTLLNLGRHFTVDQDHWPALCARLEEIVSHQTALLPMDYPRFVEQEAERIAAQRVVRRAETRPEPAMAGEEVAAAPADIQRVDVDSLALTRPHSVGVEQIGLWAMQQLGFIDLLTSLGVNGTQRAAFDHCPHGGAGFGVGGAPLAGQAERPGRTRGRGLRGDAADGAVPRVRCIV